jgi:hypothetical protein
MNLRNEYEIGRKDELLFWEAPIKIATSRLLTASNRVTDVRELYAFISDDLHDIS